jgi:hypothetical protein
MIPYINRTADILLSDNLEAKDVNVREVIDEFKSQCDTFADTFEAFVLMAPGRVRITCKSSRKLEVVEHTGFLVRGLPVEFKPISTFKWVNITRLSYGVPDEEINQVLSPYGRIRLIKHEQYSRVYTGVRNILMEITKDIPARLRIAGHWCFVHYKGQKRLCFSCGKEGHMSGACPSKRPIPDLVHDTPSQTVSSIVSEQEPPVLPAVGSSGPTGQVSHGSTSDDSLPVAAVPSVPLLSFLANHACTSAQLDSVSHANINKQDANLTSVQLSQEDSSIDAMVLVQPVSTSVAGIKRRRSPNRKSSSPISKKDRRRDKSPWGATSSHDSASDRNSDCVSEDLSFDSDLGGTVLPEFVPLPDDDDPLILANDSMDSPLSQFPPNLPGVLKGRPVFVPEDSQASEESRVIDYFFNTIDSSSAESHGDNKNRA